jgi:hypothetical protein
MNEVLKEKIDYYLDENGNMVFTKEYHLKRGHCCSSGCRHCPYLEHNNCDTPIELQLAGNKKDELYSEDDLYLKYSKEMNEL